MAIITAATWDDGHDRDDEDEWRKIKEGIERRSKNRETGREATDSTSKGEQENKKRRVEVKEQRTRTLVEKWKDEVEKGISTRSQAAMEDISEMEGEKRARRQKVRRLWDKLRRWRRKAV